MNVHLSLVGGEFPWSYFCAFSHILISFLSLPLIKNSRFCFYIISKCVVSTSASQTRLGVPRVRTSDCDDPVRGSLKKKKMWSRQEFPIF